MLRDILDKGVNLFDKVTNVVMNYTEPEIRVREATNSQPWGPHPKIMDEIVRDTRHYMTCSDVMSMLWKRMFNEDEMSWRVTYKSLILLAYLIKHGPDSVVKNAKDHMFDLRSLESYNFIDEKGKDQGVNIRYKAKDLVELLDDIDKLAAERKNADKMNSIRMQSVSSDMAGGYRGGGGGGYSDSKQTELNMAAEVNDVIRVMWNTTKLATKSILGLPLPHRVQEPYETNSRVISEDYFRFPSDHVHRAIDDEEENCGNGQFERDNKDFASYKPTSGGFNINNVNNDLKKINITLKANQRVNSATEVKEKTVVVPDLLTFDDKSNDNNEDFGNFVSVNPRPRYPSNSSNLIDDTFGDFVQPVSANKQAEQIQNTSIATNDLFDIFSPNQSSSMNSHTSNQWSNFNSFDHFNTNGGSMFTTVEPIKTIPIDTPVKRVDNNEVHLKQNDSKKKLGDLWDDIGALNINPDSLLTPKKTMANQPSLSQLKNQRNENNLLF